MKLIVDNSKRLKQQVANAQQRNAQRQQQAEQRVEYIERYVPQGATECERVSDAIREGLR